MPNSQGERLSNEIDCSVCDTIYKCRNAYNFDFEDSENKELVCSKKCYDELYS